MKNKEKIYEGKAKIIYKGTKPNTLIQNTKKTQPLLGTGLTQCCLQL